MQGRVNLIFMVKEMVAISTAWRSKEVSSGEELLGLLSQVGITQLELDFRIPPSLYQQLQPAIRRGQIKVLSLHNYFPLPEEVPLEKASADAFSLSSLDQDERERGIRYTLRTLRIAHEVGAEGVVLHLGRVEMDFQKERYYWLYDRGKINSEEGKRFLEEQRELRNRNKQRHLECLFDSLEKILREAVKLGIKVGIETRLYFHEIPNYEEIGLILEKFSGSPIYYWHDTGHAAVQENLGIRRQRDFLEAYTTHLLGIHLHDTQGYRDHLPPGKGTIDFASLSPLIGDGNLPLIRIVELHPQVSKEELLAGIDYLTSIGIID